MVNQYVHSKNVFLILHWIKQSIASFYYHLLSTFINIKKKTYQEIQEINEIVKNYQYSSHPITLGIDFKN